MFVKAGYITQVSFCTQIVWETEMEWITKFFHEYALLALAILNIIVMFKSNNKLTLLLTIIISVLIGSTLFIK